MPPAWRACAAVMPRALPAGAGAGGLACALADAQLEVLLQEPGCLGLELPVARLARVLDGPEPVALLDALERSWRELLQQRLDRGGTPVLFTSRGEIRCASAAARRRLGLALAGLMARLAAALEPQLGYLISKGASPPTRCWPMVSACPPWSFRASCSPACRWC